MSSCVTLQEKNLVSQYADRTPLTKGKKFVKCYKSLEEKDKDVVVMNVAKNVFVNVAAYSIIGGAAGTVVGGSVGYVLFNFAGIVPGALKGAAIGASIGALGGLGNSIYECKIEFERSDVYKQWVGESRLNGVYPIYLSIIKNDERFNDFLDMESLDLISVPVKAPDGKIYEQETICQWIDMKEAEIKSAKENNMPQAEIDEIFKSISYIRKCGFSKYDLVYYPSYYKELDNLVKLKIGEMEAGTEKALFEKAIAKLQKAQKKNRQAIYFAQLGKVTEYVISRKMDPSILGNVCKKLKEGYENITKEEEKKQEVEKKVVAKAQVAKAEPSNQRKVGEKEGIEEEAVEEGMTPPPRRVVE